MARYVIDGVTLLHVLDHPLLRLGLRDEKAALTIHERMTELKMRLLGDRVSRGAAWKIARQLGTSIRDAEYLAVTRLQADALVTVDANLAATADGVVPVAGLEALLVK
jgi:predicted nucleic acid-binding protein